LQARSVGNGGEKRKRKEESNGEEAKVHGRS